MEERNLDHKIYDVVIIGSGIAGMTLALSLHPGLKVVLVNKEPVTESSTYKAQGGIAVAVGPDDSPDEHIDDTLRVGQGLCSQEAVEIMAREGPAALEFLQSLGAEFHCDNNGLVLTREGGHSRNRVVHYYDYTGRYIAETLVRETCKRSNIERLNSCFLLDILTEGGKCCGCIVVSDGRLAILRAAAVVIASGGYSGLFARSTNAVSSGGDGIAAAYRAGAAIADMEFIQFHPTAFTTLSGKVFLLTEALRGEGAILRNASGERFMFAYHPSGELAPRDEVAKAIVTEAKKEGSGAVYLDARHLGREYAMNRFRQVYAELAHNHYFMERDLIPVAPAAHYTIGGIKTDLWGKTGIPGLYACGEAASVGVHGANRLASNSLLEGIVFGRRLAGYISQDFLGEAGGRNITAIAGNMGGYQIDLAALRAALDRNVGIVRQGDEISTMLQQIRQAFDRRVPSAGNIHAYCTHNACQLAELILEAALLRQESRGVHYRADFPHRDDTNFNKHTVQQWGRKAILQ